MAGRRACSWRPSRLALVGPGRPPRPRAGGRAARPALRVARGARERVTRGDRDPLRSGRRASDQLVLAHALTGRSDAGELLRTAEARGLFLTHRGTGGWFDLHALVREVLITDLASRSPSRLTDLHTRAAQWFEATDEVVMALEQWLLADRPRDVLRLLSAHHGPLYDSGQEATVKRMIAAIPTAVAVSEFEAMIDFAWCHLLVDRRRFVELVEQLTWWAERSSPSSTVRARVDVLRASAAVVSGRWVESGALSRQVMHDLGESCWQDPLGRFAANWIGREAGVVGAVGRQLRRGAAGRSRA